MLSLSSQLINRRILHSIRLNCIKTLQTNGNKLEKTLNSQTLNVFETTNGFQQIYNRLETSLRRMGRISTNEVNQCLNVLAKSGRVRPTTTQSLLLIRCCGSLVSSETPEKRRDLCKQMFESLSKTSSLDISHYNQLLRVYVENDFDFNAIEYLEEMQSKGIEPNRVTFVLMIDRFCQTGNLSEAIKILEHMKSTDMAISEAIFNSLIIGYGKAGDLQTAHQTLEMCRSSGLEPSADTYTALLCAYALNIKNANSEQKINELLEEMKRNEIELSENQLFKVIKTIALIDSESKLLDQLLNSIKDSVNYNKECLNVINDLLFASRVDVGLRLYETMIPSGMQLQQKSVGNPMIRSMINANVSPKTVLEFCDKLESEGKNEFAVRNAVDMALQTSSIADCRQYLDRLSRDQPLRVHYFYPLFTKCQNEAEILEVLSEDMQSFSGALYSQLSELFMDYIWPKNILDVNLFIEKCKSIGFSYTITFNSLIRYYIMNDRIGDAVQLMSSKTYPSINLVTKDIVNALTDSVFKSNPNFNDILNVFQILQKNPQRSARTAEVEPNDHFGHFLLILIRKGISQKTLNQILESSDRKHMRISENSVNAIRDRITLSDENEELLNKLKSKTSDDLRGVVYRDYDDITKPRREMSAEELEGHLIELKSKGFNTRGVLRSLLMAYCRRTKFNDDSNNDVLVTEARNRVKQILNELNESNHEFTNAMHAMLMEFFINTGDIESALEMKSKVSNEFEIDSYKIINFATLYVKSGQIEKGIDLIRAENGKKSDAYETEESNNQLIRTRDMSIFRLLNTLLEAKVDIKLMKEVFDLCIQYSSLTPTAIMAGPLVKYHILNDDYSEALNEYVNCAETYRITPWKPQLIRYYIEKSDQISLQKVVDYSNKIHGQSNTIMELAGICIEMGKLKQGKRLLDTPGLKVRQPRIDNLCEQFVKDDKLDALEELIRCSKNIFDINRDRMLYHLIRGCIKAENPEKALNCWTLMQEEDIQPTDTTLIFLAKYLEQNNISVPFAVPPNPIEKPIKSVDSQTKDQNLQKLSDISQNKFNIALRESNIDEAIRIKNTLESEGKTLLMSQNCSLIEALLNSDRTKEAFDISLSLLESKLFPLPRIIRFLYSKLSSNGDFESLERMRPFLPEFLIQNNAFTNALSTAYINNGKAEELIDNKLLEMKPFPLGGFLRVLEVRPDLEERLLNISNALIREQDYHLPLNMVWINCMKTGRYDDAKRIYDSCHKLKDFLLFSSLIDSIRENKDIVLAKKLIETISESNLTPKSIGVVYSALIDAYIESGDIRSAEDAVVNEVLNCTKTRIDPKSEIVVKLIEVEHLNRSTLNRLTKAIRETEQRAPKFLASNHSHPNSGPNTKSYATTSSSDDDGDSSSDEEVVDIKNNK